MFYFFHDDVKQKEKWEEGERGWVTGMYRSLDLKLMNYRKNGIVQDKKDTRRSRLWAVAPSVHMWQMLLSEVPRVFFGPGCCMLV